MARLSEAFDMETGRKLGREKKGANKILQYLGTRGKTVLAKFMHITLSWKERSSSKLKTQIII